MFGCQLRVPEEALTSEPSVLAPLMSGLCGGRFGSITRHLGLDQAAAFAESLPAVPELERELELQREEGYKGWLTVVLTALAAETRRGGGGPGCNSAADGC